MGEIALLNYGELLAVAQKLYTWRSDLLSVPSHCGTSSSKSWRIIRILVHIHLDVISETPPYTGRRHPGRAETGYVLLRVRRAFRILLCHPDNEGHDTF